MQAPPTKTNSAWRATGAFLILAASTAHGVIVADNGFGTGAMPVAAAYTAETPMTIVNGLPFGSQINIAAVLQIPTVPAELPGGGLGGTTSGGKAVFNWTMTGTGVLSAFNRVINMPYSSNVGSVGGLGNVSFEVHSASRTAFDVVQAFDTQMFRMFSQITLDTDFDLLRLTAGNDFGMPSPGKTSFVQSGSNWDAGSYFDLTYRIDFVGRPGGALGGMSGSTTATVRISLGTVVPEPGTVGWLGAAMGAALLRRRRR